MLVLAGVQVLGRRPGPRGRTRPPPPAPAEFRSGWSRTRVGSGFSVSDHLRHGFSSARPAWRSPGPVPVAGRGDVRAVIGEPAAVAATRPPSRPREGSGASRERRRSRGCSPRSWRPRPAGGRCSGRPRNESRRRHRAGLDRGERADAARVVVGAEREDDRAREAAATSQDRDALAARGARSRPTAHLPARQARQAGTAWCPRPASRRRKARCARGSRAVAVDRAAALEESELVAAGAVDVEAGSGALARVDGAPVVAALRRPALAGADPVVDLAPAERPEDGRPDGRRRSRRRRRACPSARTRHRR